MTEQGMFLKLSDESVWREAAIESARKHVPAGSVVMIAAKGCQVAWRYPSRPDLVPEDWQCEEVTI